jgi:hypothetical protein
MPRRPLAPWACHRSHQIPEMPFLLLEEGGVAGLYAERRQERVLVRERVPAERCEVEDEALWWDARLLSGRPECGYSLIHGAAEELGDPASIPERLALDEAEEVPIIFSAASPSVSSGATVRRSRDITSRSKPHIPREHNSGNPRPRWRAPRRGVPGLPTGTRDEPGRRPWSARPHRPSVERARSMRAR